MYIYKVVTQKDRTYKVMTKLKRLSIHLYIYLRKCLYSCASSWGCFMFSCIRQCL